MTHKTVRAAVVLTLGLATSTLSLADGSHGNSSAEKTVHDFQARLAASNGWITDKPEGVAILRNGRTFVVTDNDGVDDWNGETWFLDLGRMNKLFE